MLTEFITWTANPALYDGFIEIRWYGLFFAIGFIVGYNMMERMFRHEQVNLKWLDSLFIYVIIATVLGARLGHCLFYAWDYYSQHPLEILKVWEGGLASHGGAIGIIIAIGYIPDGLLTGICCGLLTDWSFRSLWSLRLFVRVI